MRWIKVSFKTHRKSGIVLIISAALHASLAFIANVH
jgi:hypothetical protein